jgi:hypothetical protein
VAGLGGLNCEKGGPDGGVLMRFSGSDLGAWAGKFFPGRKIFLKFFWEIYGNYFVEIFNFKFFFEMDLKFFSPAGKYFSGNFSFTKFRPCRIPPHQLILP